MDSETPEETNAAEESESRAFQAEVQQVLHILAHSLYTEKEIFLRELISNASDALHRIQFEMLTNADVVDPEAELAVRIDFDEDAKTLTVADTGIGMTREELIENLGTIAHSGARAFLQQLEEGQKAADIIGQFGVGFYSVYMVAEEVTVTSRSFRPESSAWSWTSGGQNSYTLRPADRAARGTEISIKLKDEAAEYASAWKLEGIIQRHSNYIAFPIYVRDSVANKREALWRKSPQEVDAEEYESFYRQLTLDPEKPLMHAHVVTDVPVDIRAVLFVPRKADRGMLELRTDHGLKLYTRNVLIQEYNRNLLPRYLRFVEGVVDSEDLPLNVSRESVQNDPVLRRIHKALTGRVLKGLKTMGEERPEDYQRFWNSFGIFVKEGLTTDPASREDLTPLLRFHTSKSGEGPVDLQTYAGRMQEGQKPIYYVIGEQLEAVARSPHLDYFKSHDLEVLYLTDPLDGFLVQALREFDGKPLQNIDDAGLELPDRAAEGEDQPAAVAGETFDRLIARFKMVLGERVVDVRASKVLKDSPCRLVTPEDSADRDLQRVLHLIEQDYTVPAKILEVNPRHALIKNLAGLLEADEADPRLDPVVEQLFENLLLLEGLHPDPAGMVPRMQAILEMAIR